MLRTPVAFIIFNRPDRSTRVFAEIAKARPARLLVVADGPRPDHPGEREACLAARSVVDQINYGPAKLTILRKVPGLQVAIVPAVSMGF